MKDKKPDGKKELKLNFPAKCPVCCSAISSLVLFDEQNPPDGTIFFDNFPFSHKVEGFIPQRKAMVANH